MFFLAGLLVAGLAGLVVMPAIARRAWRLAEARARRLAPLSVREAIAERDLLRADHAVAQHLLQRRISALQEAVGRHRADLGRQAAMLVALESGTSDRRDEMADLAEDFAMQRRDALGLQAELGASQSALNDFSVRLERALAETARLTGERIAIETLTDEQRSVIAGLETRASGIEMKLEDAAQTAKRRIAALQADLDRSADEADARRNEAARLTAELQQTRRRLAELEAAPAERQRAAAAPFEGGRPFVNGAAPPPPDVRGIRLESDGLSAGDVALREAISRLAADLARVAAASLDGAAPPAVPAKSRRREPRSLPALGVEMAKGAASSQVRQLRSMAPER